MRQLYYTLQTLIRGKGSNLIKIISLGLGLAVSILIFSRQASSSIMIPATRTMSVCVLSKQYGITTTSIILRI